MVYGVCVRMSGPEGGMEIYALDVGNNSVGSMKEKALDAMIFFVSYLCV